MHTHRVLEVWLSLHERMFEVLKIIGSDSCDDLMIRFLHPPHLGRDHL